MSVLCLLTLPARCSHLASLAHHDITIGGVAITPVEHSRSVRYLGVHTTFDGDWSEQRRKAVRMIAMFTRVAIKFKLSVKDAVYMFNTFLITKLELALRYVHGPGTREWLRQCDQLLFAAIGHLVRSPLKLSHSALSLLLGLRLPSRMEQVIKVSELFLRLNSSDTQWGRPRSHHLPRTAACDCLSHRATTARRRARLSARSCCWAARKGAAVVVHTLRAGVQ